MIDRKILVAFCSCSTPSFLSSPALKAMPQTPRQLTDAGFFYLGRGDHVQCFYCDIGLKNWEATDKPWVEHVKWSRNCAYVLHKMGAEFVELVLSNAPIDDGMLHNFEKQVEHEEWRLLCTGFIPMPS